jgi:hypothetical protein
MTAFLLQAVSDPPGTQIALGAAGLLLAGNTVMLLKLTLAAGRYVEKVDQLERRMEQLESREGCAAEDCAIRHPIRAK